MQDSHFISQMLDHTSKIAWACRRGMLELDLILGRFLKAVFPDVTQENKIRFIRLLDCNDMELFAWLIRQSDDVPEEHQIIVKMIVDYGRSGISP